MRRNTRERKKERESGKEGGGKEDCRRGRGRGMREKTKADMSGNKLKMPISL